MVSGMGDTGLDYYCQPDWCANTFGPISHNMARETRLFEAGVIRRLQPDHWDNMSFQAFDEARQVWKADYLSHIPNQQWYVKTEEEEYARYCRMTTMLGENVQRLRNMAYKNIFDPEHLPFEDFNQTDFEYWLRDRKEVVYFFIWYTVMDPGLSTAFLELLMTDYLLCFLVPKKNCIPPENMRSVEWKHIHCPSSPWDTDHLANKFSLQACVHQRAIRDSQRQGSERVCQMKNNRELDYASKSTRQSQAVGLLFQHPLKDATIIEATPTCSVCAEDFFVQDELPFHLSIARMPCCRQPLHYRYLKACADLGQREIKKAKCPFCRSRLSKHMQAERWESNWAGNFGQRTNDFDGVRIASQQARWQRERDYRAADPQTVMDYSMRRQAVAEADKRLERRMAREREAASTQNVTEDDYHAGRLNHDEWHYVDEMECRERIGYGPEPEPA